MYDAYVIYPTDATSKANFVDDFVHQILPDVLENKCGYKLCIYGREIFPGEGKHQNVFCKKKIVTLELILILATVPHTGGGS